MSDYDTQLLYILMPPFLHISRIILLPILCPTTFLAEIFKLSSAIKFNTMKYLNQSHLLDLKIHCNIYQPQDVSHISVDMTRFTSAFLPLPRYE